MPRESSPLISRSWPLRRRLALALDVDSETKALALANELAEWFGVAKVGYELYAAAGPGVVEKLKLLDLEVFLDLKLHDIPTTVGKGATVLGRLGLGYLNFHAAGGEAMLRAGVEGLAAGADSAGVPRALALAVTVLTSDPPDPAVLADRVDIARGAGCDGVVCGAPDLAAVRERFPDAVTMVPGIRAASAGSDDQVRIATPFEALSGGADVIVVGRTVTAAPDRGAAARELVASLSRLG